MSRFYMHKLSNIHVKWNYQLHQLCYCARPGNQDSVRMQLEYKDIKILHFSCALKPREWVLDSDMHAMSRSEFIEHKLFHQFLEILRAEGPVAGRGAVVTHLRSITHQAAIEWFEHFDTFLDKHPSIDALIRAAREQKSIDKAEKFKDMNHNRREGRKLWRGKQSLVKRNCKTAASETRRKRRKVLPVQFQKRFVGRNRS